MNVQRWIDRCAHPKADMPMWEMALRMLVVAAMAAAAYMMAQQDNPFFYQAF